MVGSVSSQRRLHSGQFPVLVWVNIQRRLERIVLSYCIALHAELCFVRCLCSGAASSFKPGNCFFLSSPSLLFTFLKGSEKTSNSLFQKRMDLVLYFPKKLTEMHWNDKFACAWMQTQAKLLLILLQFVEDVSPLIYQAFSSHLTVDVVCVALSESQIVLVKLWNIIKKLKQVYFLKKKINKASDSLSMYHSRLKVFFVLLR